MATKNKLLVATLREAARILAEKKPEADGNVYGALEEASGVAGLRFSMVLNATHAGDEHAALEFDNNHERVVFLLFVAEFAATGDL